MGELKHQQVLKQDKVKRMQYKQQKISFGKQENTSQKERSTSLNGVPVEELAWDYHDGSIQVPTTKSEKVTLDVVVGTQKRMNTQERTDTPPNKGDSSLKEKFYFTKTF